MQFREITGGWIRAPWYCLRRLALMTATAGSTALIAVPVSALAQDNIVATATLPRDLSPWGMYLNADPVVKAVLIGLAFASLVTWTVWLAKSVEIVFAKRRVRTALNVVVRSISEGHRAARRSGRDRVEAFHRLYGTGQHPRSGLRRALSASRQATGGASCAAPESLPPSARRRLSSACSAPSGAS